MRRMTNMLVLVTCFSFTALWFSGFFTSVYASPKKPEVIRIAFIGDLSGPYAGVTGPTYVGLLDVTEYVNKELGGIKGVPVEPVVRDSGGKVDVAISHYMELRDLKPRPLVLLNCVSSEAEALRERLSEDKLPGLLVTSTSALYPPGYSFGWYPLYSDQYGLFIDWLAEDWDRKKMGRRPKLAFLTWDSTYGRAVLTDECYAYARKKGIDVVATELFGLRDMDVSTQLAKIRNKGADWIYTNTLVHGPVAIKKSAYDLGYQVNIAGGLGLDYACIMLGGKLVEGAVSIIPYASWDEVTNRGVGKMAEYFTKNKRKKSYRTVMYHIVWATALAAVEAIERAVDEVGWERLDGEAIKNQLEKMKDYSPLDIAYFTYSPTKRSPSKAKVMRIKGGKIIPITGWRECPDLRPAKYK